MKPAKVRSTFWPGRMAWLGLCVAVRCSEGGPLEAVGPFRTGDHALAWLARALEPAEAKAWEILPIAEPPERWTGS